MSERAQEPLFFEAEEKEPRRPETSSAGGVRSPGRTGSRLWDDDGERESGRERWLSSPIEDLNLSMRAYNVLRRSGLITVGLILRQTEDELLSFRNLGRKGYDDIREHLDELGIVPMDADWDTAHGVN